MKIKTFKRADQFVSEQYLYWFPQRLTKRFPELISVQWKPVKKRKEIIDFSWLQICPKKGKFYTGAQEAGFGCFCFFSGEGAEDLD